MEKLMIYSSPIGRLTLSGDGTSITGLWIEGQKYFVCIQVQDQGCGIKEEEQGMIFERFYRSESVSSEPGFGIGLYLVREVLSKQGGYVKIKSQIGKGSTVQLYLSRYEVPVRNLSTQTD